MKFDKRQDGQTARPSVRHGRRVGKRLWMAGSLTLCAGLPAASTHAAIGVTTTTNADALVNALVGPTSGITVVPGSATYTGAANASGTFAGGDFLPFAN